MSGLSIADGGGPFNVVSLSRMEMHRRSFTHINPDDIASKLSKTSLSPNADPGPPSRSASPGSKSGMDEDEDEEGFSFFDAKDPALQENLPGPTKQPENPRVVEKYLKDLERIWYEKIQWNPQDDKLSSKHSFKPGPIKIAVLDTGIDLDHEDFRSPARRRTVMGAKMAKVIPEKTQRERIVGFRNFSNAARPNDNVTDEDGHGTHVAGLILGIAPRAELYIAKIRSAQGDSDGNTAAEIKARYDSIEAALSWAIEMKVDVINMSFGFDRISQTSPSSDGLQDALCKANHAGIIVLAAAANHANREDVAWPARDGLSAICISSGNDGLYNSSFAPGFSSKVDAFITHGEGISSHRSGGGYQQMSGTSVATPIAVGYVAMILALLNVTRSWTPEEKRENLMTRNQEKRVRSTMGMAMVLKSISRNTSGFFVLPRQVLWGTSKTAQEALRNMAREMGDI